MAQCEDCMHYRVCAKEGRMVQIDEHTWDNYNQLDDVEKFCENYISTADVVLKSEVESIITEIAAFIWQGESEKMNFPFNNHYYNKQEFIAELKKKYTEGEQRND